MIAIRPLASTTLHISVTRSSRLLLLLNLEGWTDVLLKLVDVNIHIVDQTCDASEGYLLFSSQ